MRPSFWKTPTSPVEEISLAPKKEQMKFFKRDGKSALEAKNLAQWIAFGPVIFQVARVMRNTGILRILLEKSALTLEEHVPDLTATGALAS